MAEGRVSAGTEEGEEELREGVEAPCRSESTRDGRLALWEPEPLKGAFQLLGVELLFPGNKMPRGEQGLQGTFRLEVWGESGLKAGECCGSCDRGSCHLGVLGVLCPHRSPGASSRAALTEHPLSLAAFCLSWVLGALTGFCEETAGRGRAGL